MVADDDRTFVSAAWVCRRFEISHHTLRSIVDALGNDQVGRIRLAGQKRYRFERKVVERALVEKG